MSVGRDSAGGVVSTTPTSKVAAPVLPAKSVAVQVTTVVPSEKMDPDVGVHETATDPSTISEADEENVTTAPVGPVASTENGEGTVTIGGVVSTTVTMNAPVAVLPAASETEQLTVVMPKGENRSGCRRATWNERAVDDVRRTHGVRHCGARGTRRLHTERAR